ncbi:hypothetical protein C343_00622 [Cryptococcus neoformans C23]|uniref:Ribosomal protein L9 domain-containing protein n=2 Tax=Cryptococcus neoformans TaxID=5207 RepID=A0A854QLS9_CRYNE|nr:hypothetical protein CNAG_00608 [Cryptococcus neoformans var. grubii H99]AUB22202.1 hypothetical protein CKF44_00608 [Cryptococcus neoformans var. grubii]OWZ36524.1 hypothetical protein C347_00698 [Cryptococcus neoformans var. grubii AD2-60a]OWZ48194.1 hypothetical protein C343_00622 [Cryptococcus neoformans var. grubii C23]OWZ56067.1 hypothetical protein C353_00628 [Cryptococcus neoformans var. grubii AD1-83a]OWZ57963.1 hypothetical protein C368_01135 [Cryptococcus neoformans var. grubii 1|eukprot:XP_012046839.1 hypothetical protein CNAG_00608 [Cryptococcus neoformans var. grubii H99]
MLPSSSKIFTPSIFPSLRAFSTTSKSLAKREAFVELLQDVPGLGKGYDRLFVAPGRARNDLVPARKARFVAFKDNKQRQVLRMTDEERKIHWLQVEAPGATPQNPQAPSEGSQQTPQHLLDSLFLLPSTLHFPLRTVSPTSPTLHGSLSLSNVYEVLETNHGLGSKDVEVSWVEQEAGARMKELGTWKASVKLRTGGQEQQTVDIEVDRLVSGDV